MSREVSEPAEYLTPAVAGWAELRDKGSRFLGVLLPARDEAAVAAQREDLRARFPDATHHCWAYRLGWPARERSSDAGEPAGTAGAPMLRVLAGRGLSDALVVAVRWFGGTKLGKGGLARAYAAVALEAVDAAQLVRRLPTVRVAVELPYDRLGAVKRLLRPPEIVLENETYEDVVRLTLRVALASEPELREALADLGVGRGEG